MQGYDDGNIFARILRGEIPCAKVYEDDVALAFMDIMPRVEGHVLVIPKAPARTLLDIAPDVLGALMQRVQLVGRATVAAMGAQGLTLHQFSERVGGQEVFHLHFHLLPRHEGQALRPPGGPIERPDVLAGLAARIKAELLG